MENRVMVSPLGNNEYRITFPEPLKFDINFFLLAGSHKIRVLSPNEDRELANGVEGEKETLLSWLRSLDGIDPDNIRSYEESMTE